MASRFNLARAALRSAAPSSSRVAVRSFSAARLACAEATTTPASSSAPAPPTSPKISAIVDQISTLTLIEAADLVEALKTRLNIVDIALPAASAAPAGPAAAAAPAEEAAAPKEKTMFNVTLTKIDAAQKAKAIREVKAIMPSFNLVEAKKFVESLPKTLKENVTKDEAEKLQKAMQAIGAEVTLD